MLDRLTLSSIIGMPPVITAAEFPPPIPTHGRQACEGTTGMMILAPNLHDPGYFHLD